MINLYISLLAFLGTLLHPYYLSVTEINHQAKTKSIEVTCKIITHDLEDDFRDRYKQPVDLVNAIDSLAASKMVSDYLADKLKITVDSNPIDCRLLGYEIVDDHVECYLIADEIPAVKNIAVYNAVLLDRFKEQTNLVHVTVNEKRQSKKLINPQSRAEFVFE